MSIQRVSQRTATGESIQEETQCSECGSDLRENGTEVYCEDCGLVSETNNVDYGPEWNAYSFDEEKSKTRVGAPRVPWMHDHGMGTKVGGEGDYADEKVRKLRKWQTRIAIGRNKERGLQDMMGEINRLVSELDLPDFIKAGAADITRKASKEDLVHGRSYESITSAALLLAARIGRHPVTLHEVVSLTTVEQLRIQRTMKKLQRELDLEVPPLGPSDCIEPFLGDLRSDIAQEDDFQEFKECVENVVQFAVDEGLHSSRNPRSIAAGAVYVVAKKRNLSGRPLTQQKIGDAYDVTHVTIRNRYQEIEAAWEDD